MKAATWIEKDQMLLMMRERELLLHQQKMANIATANKAIQEAKSITT